MTDAREWPKNSFGIICIEFCGQIQEVLSQSVQDFYASYLICNVFSPFFVTWFDDVEIDDEVGPEIYTTKKISE